MEFEYKVISICNYSEDTENKLNKYAREGWKVVCSYAQDNEWIILERVRKKNV